MEGSLESTVPDSIAWPERTRAWNVRPRLDARFLYHFLWQARLILRRQHGLRGLERRLERGVLRRSQAAGRPETFEVPRVRAGPDFRLEPKQHRRPVILDGFLSHSKAVREWSLDALSEHYGTSPVKVVEPDEHGRKRARLSDMASYVRAARAGADEYVMGSASFFEANGDLLREFDLPRMQRMIGRRIIRLETFIGVAGTGSSFHCAGIGNLFCQVHGEKRWTFVPPRYSPWMYPEFGKNPYAIHVTSPIRTDRYAEQRETYPLFEHAPRFTAHLKPGDVLFNPAWWWHEVENVGETIGVPIRVVTTPWTNPSFLSMALTSFLASKEFLHVIVPIFRKVTGLEPKKEKPEHELFLTDESPVLDAAIQDFYRRAT